MASLELYSQTGPDQAGSKEVLIVSVDFSLKREAITAIDVGKVD